MGDIRIKTTHVGSLIRPDDVVAIMRRLDKGEAVDPAERQAALEKGVREVVRRQKEAGVDIVSDGEFGKSSWNYYVAKRLGGIEVRPPSGETFAEMPMVATDWERFSEFYAEYFPTEQDFENPGGEFAAVGEITYEGGAEIQRDIANLKAAMEAEGVEEGFLPTVAPASCFPTLIDEHYGSSEAALKAVAKAMGEEYKAVVDSGPERAGRRRVHPLHVRHHGAPGHQGGLARLGPGADRLREPRARGAAEGEGPLPRLLGQLERPAHQRRAAARRPRPHPAGQRGHDPVRERQPAPRARVAGLGGHRPARRPRPRPGRHLHATNVVEHPELVAERIERIARIVGPERVVGSTDCGFAQGPYLRRVHPTIQWAKLEALAEGAEIASKNLGAVTA